METLARFSDRHGVSYPLLADVGSVVIGDLGLLNVTLEQERAAFGRPIEERHRGIPYPGSFFLDEDGIVVGKRFEQSHRIRPTGRTLLRQLVGDDGSGPAVGAESASPGVRVAAWLDTDVIYANQLQEVNVRFDLDADVHLYTNPVPDGFRPVGVQLRGDDRLRADPVEIEPGHKFRVAGLGDTFRVVEGQVNVALPFILLSNRDTAGDRARSLTVVVDVGYQACTATECYLPEQVSLELALVEEPNPGYETTDRAAVVPLVMRRLVEGPKTGAELLALVNAALDGVELSSAELDEFTEEMQADNTIDKGADGRWLSSLPRAPR